MITGELRSKVDKIWETFWTGGLTNPLEVIEQFTYLLFIKGLDDVETTKEAEATLLGVDFDRTFPEDKQDLRWSKFSNEGDAQKMYDIVQNKVFPFIKNLHGNKESAYAKYLKRRMTLKGIYMNIYYQSYLQLVQMDSLEHQDTLLI